MKNKDLFKRMLAREEEKRHVYFVINYDFFFNILCVCVCVCFPRLWHMEVLGLGVEWEPQLPAYTTATAMRDLSQVCNLQPTPQLTAMILNLLSEAMDWTCILMDTSQLLNAEPQWELHDFSFLYVRYI